MGNMEKGSDAYVQLVAINTNTTTIAGGFSGSALTVKQGTAASLNCTEASASSIQTNTKKIADEVSAGSGLKVNGAVTATVSQSSAASLNCTEASASSIQTNTKKVADEVSAGSGIKVNGSVTVSQGTASSLKCEEASASSIQTNTKKIADEVSAGSGIKVNGAVTVSGAVTTSGTVTEASASSILSETQAVHDALAGDLVAMRGGTAATTYPSDDTLGADDCYVFFPAAKLIEVENLDTTDYMDVCLDDGTGTYAYKNTGTPATDNVALEYKTIGTAGNSYEVEILVAGVGTSLTVTETASKITINSATDGGGNATSTPVQIAAYINSTMNTGTGSAYVKAYANGASAVSALAATALAGGAAAGAAARKLKMDFTPKFWRSYITRVKKDSVKAFTLKTAVTGLSIKANTSTTPYQVRAYA